MSLLSALCPSPIGGTESGSNGGAPIDSYKVEWSIDPFFLATEFDAGAADIPTTSYTARNLTIGERYYVRVTSRNIMGYSAACKDVGTTCAGARASTMVANSTKTTV